LGFLLFDPGFPRSVAVCLREVDELFGGLASLADLRAATARSSEIDEVVASGLHDFLDQLQRQLIRLSDDLGSTFFGHRGDHVTASQDQS
jgi:uncharacterized alpha-E superfamily protein